MIDATHSLPVKRQAELLDLSRSKVYYLLRPVAEADLVLRRIDELHLNFPLAGARMHHGWKITTAGTHLRNRGNCSNKRRHLRSPTTDTKYSAIGA